MICFLASGMIHEVRRLHSLGMDMNSSDFHGRTALHVAARRGDGLMVECLIGFNVQLNKIDCFGYRPLNVSFNFFYLTGQVLAGLINALLMMENIIINIPPTYSVLKCMSIKLSVKY